MGEMTIHRNRDELGGQLVRENGVELIRMLTTERLVIGGQISQLISALGAEIVKNLGGELGREVCWELSDELGRELARDLGKELTKALTGKSAKRSSESSAVEERCG